jgi:hypothetical protein
MPWNGSSEVIASVLRRLGIDPAERFGKQDQDPEYTSCRTEEVAQYFDLYSTEGLSAGERAVLCCFILESLNDLIQSGCPHVQQNSMIDELMASDGHAEELAYWMNTDDPDEDHWWPITKVLLRRRNAMRR